MTDAGRVQDVVLDELDEVLAGLFEEIRLLLNEVLREVAMISGRVRKLERGRSSYSEE